MVRAGFAREFARQFIADAAQAYRSVLDISIKLARFFPDVQFVLRPHPFENIRSYNAFAELPNAHVKQDGTSLEWIAGARLLVHQNCSTAIEATMLGVEPLSMEWFNTPALRLDAATRVSRGAASEADLIDLVQRGLDEEMPAIARKTEEFRRQIIGDLFTAIDGASAVRVTDVIFDAIGVARQGSFFSTTLPRPSVRGLLTNAARRMLGHKASSALRRAYGSPENERRRSDKAFGPEMVNSVLQRISVAAADGRNFVAHSASTTSRVSARAMSGTSLQLTEAI